MNNNVNVEPEAVIRRLGDIHSKQISQLTVDLAMSESGREALDTELTAERIKTAELQAELERLQAKPKAKPPLVMRDMEKMATPDSEDMRDERVSRGR